MAHPVRLLCRWFLDHDIGRFHCLNRRFFHRRFFRKLVKRQHGFFRRFLHRGHVLRRKLLQLRLNGLFSHGGLERRPLLLYEQGVLNPRVLHGLGHGGSLFLGQGFFAHRVLVHNRRRFLKIHSFFGQNIFSRFGYRFLVDIRVFGGFGGFGLNRFQGDLIQQEIFLEQLAVQRFFDQQFLRNDRAVFVLLLRHHRRYRTQQQQRQRNI